MSRTPFQGGPGDTTHSAGAYPIPTALRPFLPGTDATDPVTPPPDGSSALPPGEVPAEQVDATAPITAHQQSAASPARESSPFATSSHEPEPVLEPESEAG